MARAIIEKKKFIRHYMYPTVRDVAMGTDDPRPKLVELIREGKEDEAIAAADPKVTGRPMDPRCFNALITAHIHKGNWERAMQIAEVSIAYWKRIGDTMRLAISLTLKASILWRKKGLDQALAGLNDALAADNCCRSAIINRLCYASLSRRDDLLKQFVSDLRHTAPGYFLDSWYRFYLSEDAQLAYLRSTKYFTPIQKSLDSVIQKEEK